MVIKTNSTFREIAQNPYKIGKTGVEKVYKLVKWRRDITIEIELVTAETIDN